MYRSCGSLGTKAIREELEEERVGDVELKQEEKLGGWYDQCIQSIIT